MGLVLSGTSPGLGCGVTPLGCLPATPPPRPWPQIWGSSSQLFLCHHSLAFSAPAPDLGSWVILPGCRPSSMGSSRFCPWPRTWGSSSQLHLVGRSQPPALSAPDLNSLWWFKKRYHIFLKPDRPEVKSLCVYDANMPENYCLLGSSLSSILKKLSHCQRNTFWMLIIKLEKA